MKNKKLFKVISIILVVIMFLHIVPQSVIAFAAEKVKANKSIGSEISDQEEMTSKIVREATELREESVKHFLCEDGSYIAATYSEPVHYKENGEWKEIDNSLTLKSENFSESDKPSYSPKAGNLSISIPQDFSDGQQVSVKNKGHKINFGIKTEAENSASKNSATVVEVDELTSNTTNTQGQKKLTVQNEKYNVSKNLRKKREIENYNAEIMTVEKQSGAVTYKEIFPNTDLEYIVTSNSLKENIVVHKPQNEYKYNFDMDFGELIPITHDDGSISLVEKDSPDRIIYWMEAPYMYDANNEESIEIEMTLEENGEGYILTLEADADWINSTEREFPVVIDPTFYFLDSAFNDVFVIDGLYANSPRVKNEIRVGRNLANVTRTYIKMELPENVPYGSVVNSANLVLKKDYYFQNILADDISIQVYDCYGVSTWEPDEISWNNQPFLTSEGSFSKIYAQYFLSKVDAGKDVDNYVFDISAAVQRWINNGKNNGLMIKSSNENSKTQVDFYSSRVSNSSNRPAMYFSYVTSGVGISSWNAGTEKTTSPEIDVTSSVNWIATTDQPWITVSPTSGNKSEKIAITVEENANVGKRSGLVLITAEDKVIGKIEVTQFGIEPTLTVNTDEWIVGSVGGEKTVSVTSNTGWSVTTSSWIDISNSSGVGDGVFTVTANENTESNERYGYVRVVSGSIVKEIFVIQFDSITNYFYDVNEDNLISRRSSSEYNHPLATWAMYLSYLVYNPIPDGFAQAIPGLFIENSEKGKTIDTELNNKGFDGFEKYNDDSDNDAVAHTIAHKEIFDENGDTKTLVVIVVRGSVTAQDWILNINTQLDAYGKQFEDGSEMVLKNLFLDVENCTECGGKECKECKGYLKLKKIEDPIILVTGHSLGAAVANLTAKHLDSCLDINCEYCGGKAMDMNDIYAYTFATPFTKEDAEEKEDAESKYPNIYNFLNVNDAVTFMPINLKSLDLDGGSWFRYGKDFHIRMDMKVEWLKCLDTAWLGLGGHAMPTYNEWMKNLPSELEIKAESISEEQLRSECCGEIAIGLLPKLIKVKCPVGVTLYDDDNNIVASQNNYAPPSNSGPMDDIYTMGIVSWTTDEGEKMFIIPYGCEDVSIRIKAYDYGSMEFTAQTLGLSEPLESKEINNVSLYPGKQFEASILSDVSVEDVDLFYMRDDGTYKEITDLNPLLKSATVENLPTSDGIQSTVTITTDKNVTGIKLINRDNGVESVYHADSPGLISVVEDGDVLVWTILHVVESDSEFDVSVKSEEIWYLTERVFEITMYEIVYIT